MRLAIIVGHSKASPGAYGCAPLSSYEYDWNSAVAQEMYRFAKENGLDAAIFHRDRISIESVANFVNKWEADAAIELHFNAANTKATGTETLHDDSKELAEIVQSEMCSLFSRQGKQNRGVKLLTDGDRGNRSLKAIKVPAVIVEPAFGDNKDDALLLVQNQVKYAHCLVMAVIEFLKKREG